MKRIFSCLAVAFLLIFALAIPAGAAPLTFNSYPAGFNDGSYFVGEASGTLSNQTIAMWCVDSLHRITGNSWDVSVVNLSNPASLAGLNGLTVNDYKAMFLLGLDFGANQASDVSLQHQIWSFADPGNYPLTLAEQANKSDALASIGTYNWTNALVLVPTGKNGQIFETGTVSPVPEPATFALMGFGLIIIGLVASRRKTQQ